MLCVVSCLGLYIFAFEPPFPQTSGIRPVWVDKMLHSPTCELPCWENITPGVTHLNEVPNLLEQVPGVERTYPTIKGGEDDSYTEWLMDSGSNTKDNGWANSPSADGIIYNIILMLDFESYIPVGDFIDIYGQPEYLKAYGCDLNFCTFQLVYPELGAKLELVIPGRGWLPWQREESRIETNSAVEKIILYPIEYRKPNSPLIVTWHGFGVYDGDGNFSP